MPSNHTNGDTPLQPQDLDSLAASANATIDTLKKLRERLLDLKKSNPLLNYRHSDRSKTQIRVINEVPDFLYQQLLDEASLTFRPIPLPVDGQSTDDESTDAFTKSLETARLSDEEYLDGLKKLNDSESDEDEGTALEKLERDLRDRVRIQLNLPPLRQRPQITAKVEAEKHGINTDFDLPALDRNSSSEVEAHGDPYIQTLHFPDDMDKRLIGIRERANSDFKEKGIDSMYCAFGFLEWRESESSDRPLHAPLLLHPVSLERGIYRGRWQFGLVTAGEHAETTTNITLEHRLRRDFGIELPPFEENDTLEAYFKKVTSLIEAQPRCSNWKVRRFVTIGIYSFARIVLYNDLDSANWPEESKIHNHPLMLSLWGGQPPSSSGHEAQSPKRTEPAEEPVLITDADSSQIEAIIQVLDGKSTVVYGPPGTGKSQTITNIIGAALNEGKKVLFLAEKMAALQVVAKRLSKYGLGEFCLELHSVGTNKKALLEKLEQRLNMRQPAKPRDLEDSIQEKRQVQKRLDNYVETLNSKYGAIDDSIHTILWTSQKLNDEARSKNIPDKLLTIEIPGAKEYRHSDLRVCVSALQTLATAAEPLQHDGAAIASCPWNGVTETEITAFDVETYINALKSWTECLTSLMSFNPPLEELSVKPETITRTALASIATTLNSIPTPSTDLDLKLFCLAADKSLLPEISKSIELFQNFQQQAVLIKQHPHFAPVQETICGLRKLEDLSAPLTRDLKDCTLAECHKSLANIEAEVRETTNCRNTVHAVASAFGIPAPHTLADGYKLIYALTLVGKAKRQIITNLSQGLSNETNRKLILDGQSRAKELRQRESTLKHTYIFSLEADSKLLRQHARNVRTAGFLAKLRGPYRAAKKSFVEITGGKSPDPDANSMASVFDEIAQFLDEYQSFISDPQLKEVLGNLFVGLTTDFDLCLQILDYTKDAGRQFASLDTFTSSLRSLVLNPETRIADAAAAQVTDTSFRDSKRFLLARRELNPRLSDEFESICREGSTLAEQLRSFLSETSTLNCPLETKVSELPTIRAHLEKTLALNESLSRESIFQGRLGLSRETVLSNLDKLIQTANSATRLHEATLSISLIDKIFNSSNPAAIVAACHQLGREIEELLSKERQAYQHFCELCRLDTIAWMAGADNGNVAVDDIIARNQRALLSPAEALIDWANYGKARTDVAETIALPLANAFFESGHTFSHLPLSFKCCFYRTLSRSAFSENPSLSRFSGTQKEQAREQYRKLDVEIIELQRRALAAALWRKPIDPGSRYGYRTQWTGRALIENEISKKKRHIPIRDLLSRAFDAILDMQPCFMMSPVSAAQFIKPGAPRFDLVVIDEASQMKPEDAIGAICRANQLVVVGDPKQLPPTTFFDSQLDDSDAEDFEELADNESILDAARLMFPNSCHLQWHYRSRHEDLIAFSNTNFYDDNLIVFPSPGAADGMLGVHQKYIQGSYKKGINRDEVQAIVSRAIEIMTEEPESSLGIVAMNQKQADLINSEMENVFLINPVARKFRETWEAEIEYFFVKNLENVQGDERDIILISTVYGPEVPGGTVPQRFGPINSAHGHRRLNVLFTRARRRIEVFTSLRPNDVHPSQSGHMGPGILRAYLDYSGDTRGPQSYLSGREPDSEFEIFVMEQLRKHGYQVVPQIGVAGFFIDLGVLDPTETSRFALGVECDGATYHSAKNARDRDRIRQSVLEELGWKIHRIWSTDWFNNTQGEMAKLLKKLKHV